MATVFERRSHAHDADYARACGEEMASLQAVVQHAPSSSHATSSGCPACSLRAAQLVVDTIMHDAIGDDGPLAGSPRKDAYAASYAAVLFAQAAQSVLRAVAAATGHASERASVFSAANACRGETLHPALDWTQNSNRPPCFRDHIAIAPVHQQSSRLYKLLLDAVRGLSGLFRDNAISLRATVPKHTTDFGAVAWREGVQSARDVLDQLDDTPQSDPTLSAIKAHALYILSVASPEDADTYLQRLANLPAKSPAFLRSEVDALLASASRRLSKAAADPVPVTERPPASSALRHTHTTPAPTPPIPFPSTSNSRAHSRSGSLFSVVVTPASYISTPTSPSTSPPVSGSFDDNTNTKPSVPSAASRNPLLERMLGVRTRRAQSLQGAPTLALTPCQSQNMGSFTPPESASDAPSGSNSRSRATSTSLAGARAGRSTTLPSAGTASRSLKAVFAQAHVRPNPNPNLNTGAGMGVGASTSAITSTMSVAPRRVRPSLPWSWWSASASKQNQTKTKAQTQEPSNATPAPSPKPSTSPPRSHSRPSSPPMDAVLALQERSSRLLGSRQCATCGAADGSFPQCARGCGVAWCSRECRMANKQAHMLTCSGVCTIGRASGSGSGHRAHATIG